MWNCVCQPSLCKREQPQSTWKVSLVGCWGKKNVSQESRWMPVLAMCCSQTADDPKMLFKGDYGCINSLQHLHLLPWALVDSGCKRGPVLPGAEGKKVGDKWGLFVRICTAIRVAGSGGAAVDTCHRFCDLCPHVSCRSTGPVKWRQSMWLLPFWLSGECNCFLLQQWKQAWELRTKNGGKFCSFPIHALRVKLCWVWISDMAFRRQKRRKVTRNEIVQLCKFLQRQHKKLLFLENMKMTQRRVVRAREEGTSEDSCSGWRQVLVFVWPRPYSGNKPVLVSVGWRAWQQCWLPPQLLPMQGTENLGRNNNWAKLWVLLSCARGSRVKVYQKFGKVPLTKLGWDTSSRRFMCCWVQVKGSCKLSFCW